MNQVIRPDFEKYGGLVTVVTVDYMTGKILTVASVDEACFRETLMTGYAVYFSKSRQKRHLKGEESGNFQMVQDIWVDCDRDAIIYFVEQKGDGACHTGKESCFHRTILEIGKAEESELMEVPLNGVFLNT